MKVNIKIIQTLMSKKVLENKNELLAENLSTDQFLYKHW